MMKLNHSNVIFPKTAKLVCDCRTQTKPPQGLYFLNFNFEKISDYKHSEKKSNPTFPSPTFPKW